MGNRYYFGVAQKRRRIFLVAGLGEYPPLEFMGDAGPVERSLGAGCQSTAWSDAFPTLLAGLRGGTSIDLSFGNIIAVPESRHQMVKRRGKTEADGFLRGLAQTDFEEARAAGNAVVPQVARWIAEKLIRTF